ncbi:MAG: BMP family ABC transporter substrate-binding protein [Pseudomonadota bacterium]
MKRKWMVSLGLLVVAAVCLIVQVAFAQKTLPLKVTLIFDIGGRGDGGFNDSAYRGLERAVADLGVKVVYLEPGNSLDRENALNAAAASDAEMIIGAGFVFTDPMNALAAQYPDKKFVCVDYGIRFDKQGRIKPFPENLAALLFKEEEGSYLVGAIAALKSRTGKIGFIGGMDNPIIRKFQSGYLAGAKAVRPGIKVFSEFAGITGKAFNDPAKGYLIANRIYGQGADIIYHAAGVTGEGLFRAVKNRHLLAIGVDIDQSAQAPGLILTSMTKHVDVAVFESVKACVEGNFSGGVKSFGLKENGVGFVYDDYNKALIPESIHDKILLLREKILSGELIVPAVGDGKPLLSRNDLRDLLSELKEEITTALTRNDSDPKYGEKMLSVMELNGIIAPVAANLPVDIFLMQTDGLMVYDVDPEQIGRNVFHDPLYQPFPDLLALAKKVAANKKGTGVYRFYQAGSGKPVIKKAFWKTIGRHGAEWRIVITCEKEHIGK